MSANRAGELAVEIMQTMRIAAGTRTGAAFAHARVVLEAPSIIDDPQ